MLWCRKTFKITIPQRSPSYSNETRHKFVSNLAWKVRAANLEEFSTDFSCVSTRIISSTLGSSAGHGLRSLLFTIPASWKFCNHKYLYALMHNYLYKFIISLVNDFESRNGGTIFESQKRHLRNLDMLLICNLIILMVDKWVIRGR